MFFYSLEGRELLVVRQWIRWVENLVRSRVVSKLIVVPDLLSICLAYKVSCYRVSFGCLIDNFSRTQILAKRKSPRCRKQHTQNWNNI
jgi:hypothetical protein